MRTHEELLLMKVKAILLESMDQLRALGLE